MSWTFIVQALQGFNGLAWLVPLGINARPLYRLLTGRERVDDVFFAIAWFIAFAQCMFIVRWLAWSHQVPDMGTAELQFWAACYLLNGVAPLAAYFVHWRIRRSL